MKPPKHLSREAKTWWRRLLEEYAIDDEAGLLTLLIAMEAFDRMREAQALVGQEGATILDRFGQLKSNPMLVVERDSRGQMLQALRSLNLDLEPLRDGPGRPPGR